MNSCKIYKQKQYGFNLIELMVTMLIGSIIILGVVNLFGSTQQTHKIKEKIDHAHETFRFTSYTLMKMIRSASDVTVNEANNEITITFNGGGDQMNCVGQAATTGESNRLYLEGDVLMCDTGIANLRLATGISSITFNEYMQNVTDSINNSIRTSITMESGHDLSFVTTVRSIAITQQAYVEEDGGDTVESDTAIDPDTDPASESQSDAQPESGSEPEPEPEPEPAPEPEPEPEPEYVPDVNYCSQYTVLFKSSDKLSQAYVAFYSPLKQDEEVQDWCTIGNNKKDISCNLENVYKNSVYTIYGIAEVNGRKNGSGAYVITEGEVANDCQ